MEAQLAGLVECPFSYGYTDRERKQCICVVCTSVVIIKEVVYW